MATELKTRGQWETRVKNVDRHSATPLTVEEAALSVLLSIRTLSGWLLGLSVLGILLLILVVVVVSTAS